MIDRYSRARVCGAVAVVVLLVSAAGCGGGGQDASAKAYEPEGNLLRIGGIVDAITDGDLFWFTTSKGTTGVKPQAWAEDGSDDDLVQSDADGVYLAAGGGRIWVAKAFELPNEGTSKQPCLSEVDSSSGVVLNEITLTEVGNCGPIAFGHGSVWMSNPQGLVRVDPDSGEADVVPLEAGLSGKVAIGSDAVYAVSGATIARVDPDSLDVTATARATGRSIAGSTAVVSSGGLWITGDADSDFAVRRLDLDTLEPTGGLTNERSTEAGSIAASTMVAIDDEIWAVGSESKKLLHWRADAAADAPIEETGGDFTAERGVPDLVATGGGLFVLLEGHVVFYDPSELEPQRTFE